MEASGTGAWGRGRGAGRKTGVEAVGKAGSVEPGRTGMVRTGGSAGNPGVPVLPSMNRWMGG